MAKRTIRTLGTFVCLATVLPLLKAKAAWIRVFDFPRVHVSALGALALAAGLAGQKPLSSLDRWLLRLVAAAVAGQLLQIARYTPVVPPQVVRTKRDGGLALRLLIANVYMRNQQIQPLLALIKQHRPDVVLLMEPDRWWVNQLAELEAEYPYVVKHPQENTYGICLYSKLELLDPQIRFLVQQDVPSIRARLRLPDQNTVWFYGLHPKPPGRENRYGEVRGTGPRDAELIVAAKEIRELNEPVVVAGDFNDVAWSHTTQRFQRLGKLLDPRIGRGFYNSFHAGHPLWRFPVDHLFHSQHFSVSDFGRLSYIGSDHFPIFAVLGLEPAARQAQAPPRTTAADAREGEEELQAAGLPPGSTRART